MYMYVKKLRFHLQVYYCNKDDISVSPLRMKSNVLSKKIIGFRNKRLPLDKVNVFYISINGCFVIILLEFV